MSESTPRRPSLTDVLSSAMRFLENTDLLKIEDVLPFFPDFVVIDDFKEEITNALEGYSNQINELKSKMEEMLEIKKHSESLYDLLSRVRGADVGCAFFLANPLDVADAPAQPRRAVHARGRHEPPLLCRHRLGDLHARRP